MHRLRHRITGFVSGLYAWITIIMCGGIAVETIIIYPNVFHDVPDSLALSVDFFTVLGPTHFFPPLGTATAAIGIVTLTLVWSARQARLWIGASLVSLFSDYLYSMLFFWPRNETMFDEGMAVHSTEVLRTAATEFETGHWGRLTLSILTATFAFVGFIRYHRLRVLTVAATCDHEQSEPALTEGRNQP